MAANQSDVTPFGGITGRVLREALSAGSFLTGFVVVAAALLAGWWLNQMRAQDLAPALFHLREHARTSQPATII